jgi:hypothetical protein
MVRTNCNQGAQRALSLFAGPAGSVRRHERRCSALSLRAELLILCARIGFNP